MYLLAEILPFAKKIKLPFSRDQFILLLAAINEIFLGLDIWLAHSVSGTIVPNEWIPIIFGPVAGGLLLIAGVIAFRHRTAAIIIANATFISSIIVGLLGAFFHVRRAILPSGPVGAQISLPLLVWAPPVIGPLMFSLIGLIGMSAAWKEDMPDSGILQITQKIKLRMPYSKTRAYLFMVSMGTLATLISSVLDHARTTFTNPWLWLPTAVGVLGVVTALILGIIDNPTKKDIWTYAISMTLMLVVGVVGMLLHIGENLTSEGLIVQERFIRGAPFLAPMLYANMGLLGLLVMLKSGER